MFWPATNGVFGIEQFVAMVNPFVRQKMRQYQEMKERADRRQEYDRPAANPEAEKEQPVFIKNPSESEEKDSPDKKIRRSHDHIPEKVH